jgi:hypothetical protein
MVLIISRFRDSTTNSVVKWLHAMRCQVLVFTKASDFVKEALEISVDKRTLLVNGEAVNSIWLRKAPMYDLELPQATSIDERHFIKSELQALLRYIMHCDFKSKLGTKYSYDLIDIDKAFVLKQAVQVGLRVPTSTVVNRRTMLARIPTCITKPLGETFMDITATGVRAYYTTKLESKQKKYASKFFPSLVQQQIEKAWEVRALVVNNSVTSIALLSQANESTRIDFRNYDDICPTRIVPYKLPKAIEDKLLRLTCDLECNICVADFIVDANGEHVFLEVNPVGQFENIALYGSGNVDKRIAEYLYEKN